jgi:hypothetical protein
MLSQQLQHTRITPTALGSDGSAPATHVLAPQRPNIGTRLASGETAAQAQRYPSDTRIPSNSSNGAIGKGRDRIDEELEEPEGVFDMEALEDVPGAMAPPADSSIKQKKGGLKRLSGGNGWGFFGSNRSAPKVELGDSDIGRV